mgnify:CR=1 FL=1
MFPCPKPSGLATETWVDVEFVYNTPSMIPYMRMVQKSCRAM